MECAERGLIDAPWLRFGDSAALLRALDEIGDRGSPLGSLLAEGSRRASRTVGADSASFASHVKGLEMPGYEPRTLHSMALGLAVNARGADHNRSGAYEADLSGDYFTGALSLADFTIFPHLRLLGRVEDRQPGKGIGNRMPAKLAAWMKRIEALPYYQKTIPPHWKG